jgi:primosomal protein N' (replication factor Y) (superfamily II helicase)
VPPSGTDTPVPAEERIAGFTARPVVDPVARVLVDVGLAHLDRPFDYAVTAEQAALAVPGSRVRVMFAGRLVSGYVLERTATSEHVGALTPLQRVVSAEPVLTPEVAELSRRVAEHYAGTRADVLRLAVPPRHARTEQAAAVMAHPAPTPVPEPGGWAELSAGTALLDALAAGGRPRAVATLLPGADWPDMLARAAAATASSGRGTVIVVPEVVDVDAVDASLRAVLGGGERHVTLHAEQGPSARYRRFLKVVRGHVAVVVGTRSAVFAPVRDLSLVVVWDDGDDLLAEPRAPYPHARDVALIRAHQQQCAVVLAGYARTAEAARLVSTRWAHEVRAARATVRQRAPRVSAVGSTGHGSPAARVPEPAFRMIRAALTADAGAGPVLVQVPRRGYRPALACQQCRAPARCPRCAGPLAQEHADALPVCHWCSHEAAPWVCPRCAGTRLRAVSVGDERTAEELGRAFPGVPVRTSGLGHVLAGVAHEPSLVVSTPGAEPRTDGGYRAALLLDADTMLGRPDLRAAEESLRRWMAAAAMVVPAGSGGEVMLVGDPGHRAVQALVRWDPAGFATRELADRVSAALPPAARIIELVGPATAVAELVEGTELPPTADVLGPVPTGPDEAVRLLLRTPLSDGAALTAAVRAAAGGRSARRRRGSVRVRVDPVDLG